MNKTEFDQKFSKVIAKISPESEAEIIERVKSYTKDINHMSIYELAAYLRGESIRYTNDLVYNLFLETVVGSDG